MDVRTEQGETGEDMDHGRGGAVSSGVVSSERMAAEAMKRLQAWINRSAGQHLRAMKRGVAHG